jgi:hypothetical protein
MARFQLRGIGGGAGGFLNVLFMRAVSHERGKILSSSLPIKNSWRKEGYFYLRFTRLTDCGVLLRASCVKCLRQERLAGTLAPP